MDSTWTLGEICFLLRKCAVIPTTWIFANANLKSALWEIKKNLTCYFLMQTLHRFHIETALGSLDGDLPLWIELIHVQICGIQAANLRQKSKGMPSYNWFFWQKNSLCENTICVYLVAQFATCIGLAYFELYALHTLRVCSECQDLLLKKFAWNLRIISG